MPKILIIEDDPQIIQAVEKTVALERGFMIEAVTRAEQALPSVIRYKPDLILLDIRMPGGDGRLILKSLKENASTRSIPVIFLTGLSSEGDKVLGLNLGADDYVVKPFGAMELLARVKTVLRRTRPQARQGKALEAHGLCIDAENRSAILDGKKMKLQPKEFEILYLLAFHPGRVLTRNYLIENSSSYGLPISTRSLDTHIKNLRKKLGRKAHLIQTVSKMGYVFSAPR